MIELAEIPLTPEEQNRLAELELVVKTGRDAFVSVGRALQEIRDCKLYRDTHSTFAAYCNDRWELSKGHAYRLMGAVSVLDNLSPRGDFLPTEKVLRPLTKLGSDEQAEAFNAALEESGGSPTASDVQRQADRILRRNRHPKRPESFFHDDLMPRFNAFGSLFAFEGPAGFDEDWTAPTIIAFLPKHPQMVDVFFHRIKSRFIDHAICVTVAETNADWFHDLPGYHRVFIKHPREQLVAIYSGTNWRKFRDVLAPLGVVFQEAA
jgi:hypothetical protein